MTFGRFADGLAALRAAFPLRFAHLGRAIGAAPAAKENAQGGNPGRSDVTPPLGERKDMNTLPQAPDARQMAAGRAALLRWYPTMPLRMVDALRLHRPGYPLIAGGKDGQGRVRT
jgi:hypothetical protein